MADYNSSYSGQEVDEAVRVATSLPTDVNTKLGRIPNTLGTAGQVLQVNANGNGTEWKNPDTKPYGSNGQVLTIKDGRPQWVTPSTQQLPNVSTIRLLAVDTVGRFVPIHLGTNLSLDGIVLNATGGGGGGGSTYSVPSGTTYTFNEYIDTAQPIDLSLTDATFEDAFLNSYDGMNTGGGGGALYYSSYGAESEVFSDTGGWLQGDAQYITFNSFDGITPVELGETVYNWLTQNGSFN